MHLFKNIFFKTSPQDGLSVIFEHFFFAFFTYLETPIKVFHNTMIFFLFMYACFFVFSSHGWLSAFFLLQKVIRKKNGTEGNKNII